ncbi:hypothetical protein F383_30666 [Gossypium arboreum]|uniref:Uncharacterized protein n=1 Tax=Gossypium arboreum TaxID=29729 RepID=A0A0B0MWV8_GOSAR|nr:hypothetical protein F383_30666 [Gossypium arboreum]
MRYEFKPASLHGKDCMQLLFFIGHKVWVGSVLTP